MAVPPIVLDTIRDFGGLIDRLFAVTNGLTAVPILTDKGQHDPRVIAQLLLLRTASHVRAIIALVPGGQGLEMKILARNCVENFIFIERLVSDGDSFVRKMVADNAKSDQALGQLHLERHKDHLPEELQQRLRTFLTRLANAFPKAQYLNPKSEAFSGVVSDAYFFYARLSASAAHPSLRALWRYLRGEGDGGTFSIGSDAAEGNPYEIAEGLEAATLAFLGALVGYNQILGNTATGAQLRDLADEFNALRVRRVAFENERTAAR